MVRVGASLYDVTASFRASCMSGMAVSFSGLDLWGHAARSSPSALHADD
jgi:hypothetical protein